jgi:hypothetical protein
LHVFVRYGFTVPVVQIRDLSDAAHRRLKARAALNGQSLSEYLRLELERVASLPTLEEMLERVSRRAPVSGEPGADAVRAGRRARDAA